MNRVARVLVPGLLLLAAYVAVFGGEYSMLELRDNRAQLERDRLEWLDLESQIESMTAWSDSLRDDPYTLERVARERFGMIRPGETLYRFAEPDSAS